MKISSKEMKKRVWKHAEQFYAQNHCRPTVDQLRQEIGQGSNSTIGPLLKEWWKEKSDSLVISSSFPVPKKAYELGHSLIENIWKIAIEVALDIHSRLENQARLKCEKLAAENEVLRRENAKLESTCDQLKLKADVLEQSLQILRESVVTLSQKQ